MKFSIYYLFGFALVYRSRKLFDMRLLRISHKRGAYLVQGHFLLIK